MKALWVAECVARHGRLVDAAEELGVTPGALSQQLRQLEERVGDRLFLRTRDGMKPTATLAEILPDLQRAMSALQRAGSRLMSDKGRVLNVTLGSVSASRWLVWQLAHFTAKYPELEVRLFPTEKLVDLSRLDVDCGIRFGTGNWENVNSLLLSQSWMFPVASPVLAERLRTPQDLEHVPVIAEKNSMLSWDSWLKSAGTHGLKLKGPTYTDPVLAFEAAVSGQAVLLAIDLMAENAIRQGQLVAPFAQRVRSPNSYWFVTAKGRQPAPRVRKFRDWLLSEARGRQY